MKQNLAGISKPPLSRLNLKLVYTIM